MCSQSVGFENDCFSILEVQNLVFSILSPNDKKKIRPRKAA